tara:strand:- start:604 stop:966 length:363 start_codon:yes stop_codon:yes gene_type:complete
MKKSEFKEYLKTEIVSVLEEASESDVSAQKDYNAELEKTISLSKEAGLTESPKEDEDEPSPSDLKKGDSVVAKAKNIQKIVAKMKGLAKEFKAANGDLKDKIKDELKGLTAEKKKLERDL